MAEGNSMSDPTGKTRGSESHLKAPDRSKPLTSKALYFTVTLTRQVYDEKMAFLSITLTLTLYLSMSEAKHLFLISGFSSSSLSRGPSVSRGPLHSSPPPSLHVGQN
ncbi:hypothetical protein BaRGS_00011135 [Batillaria attramentaria]|uniref:Uncharacterized protein n=1 Tax=Batillaria attramentaria TaxID=370345 RepID=A0ABD0LEH8_9CAEN